MKEGTKDVDICVFAKDIDVIDFARAYSRRTKIRVDIFLDGWIQPVRFPDMFSRATPAESSFSKIELFTMDRYDMALTKIDRWSDKDREDITALLNKIPCFRQEMEVRYNFILKQFHDQELHYNFKTNYELFQNILGFLLKEP